MPLAAPVAFPLFGITPQGACACGSAACARIGKHPAVAWGEISLGDEVDRPEEGAGAGLKTGAAPKGSGVFVVDIDGLEAWEAWQELEALGRGWTEGDYADDRISTFMVETGRAGGGWQLYFQHPGFHVKNSAGELAPGVDVRGDGGFVVAPGSPHKSGKSYEIVHDVEPAPAPAWLLEWLRSRPAALEIQSYPGDISDPEELAHRRGLYTDYLREDAPARGPALRGKGDATLFEVVQKGAFDLALPTSDVLELVREHYDPRCSPHWGDELEERVIHKAHSAKTVSTRPRAEPIPATLAAFLEMPPVPEATGIGSPTHACTWKIRQGGWEVKPPPPRFLVANLLIEEKVSMIFADSGSIKTWTAESIAVAVSRGEPWLGDSTVSQGPVLYVDFEDAEDEFNRRIYLLNRGRSADDLHYVYQPEFANTPSFWIQLGLAVRERGIKLVIIDTLAGATPNEDENDRRAAAALQMAGGFTSDAKVSVLFLHHANRNGDIRGTSAFKANVDSLFWLETIEDDEEKGIHRARLVNTKSGQRKVRPVALELTDEGLRRFVETEATEPADAELEGKRRSYEEIEADVYLKISAYGPIGSIEKIRILVSGGSPLVQAALKELEAQGRIVKATGGYQLDDEEKRRARLLGTVAAHPTWDRKKIVDRAFLTGEFFERAVGDGLIFPKAKGRDDQGYVTGRLTS